MQPDERPDKLRTVEQVICRLTCLCLVNYTATKVRLKLWLQEILALNSSYVVSKIAYPLLVTRQQTGRRDVSFGKGILFNLGNDPLIDFA